MIKLEVFLDGALKLKTYVSQGLIDYRPTTTELDDSTANGTYEDVAAMIQNDSCTQSTKTASDIYNYMYNIFESDDMLCGILENQLFPVVVGLNGGTTAELGAATVSGINYTGITSFYIPFQRLFGDPAVGSTYTGFFSHTVK